MKKIFFAIILAVCLTGLAFAQTGVKRKKQKSYEYGMSVIDNFSVKAGIAPAIFDHWRHRSRYTCRLCHVDIGFGMKTGATQIRALNNMRGYYCGTCHNGKMIYDSNKVLFAACSTETSKANDPRCAKCHYTDKLQKKEEEFYNFAKKYPKGRFGNGIDWEKAEETGLIKPIDFIEGISMKRMNIAAQKDFSLGSKFQGMPDIIFSHKKHTVWNGCEVCHPEIFIGIKKGTNKYTMVEIFDGKYCGACHISVAFPMADCQRCHTKSVH